MIARLNSRLLLTAALWLAAHGALLAQSSPVHGAIFTTTFDGSAVNANLYDSKCAVYLDGGPGPHAPAHAAGLADGEYYFQVTDPSGKTLLSTDPVSNRRFRVSQGVIVAYTGTGGLAHPTGIDRDHPELGAITIRLANTSCPSDFLNTSNDGGAYKAWATPVSDFAGDPAKVDNDCGRGCYHGFVPSKSKTDNFKARPEAPTFCLTLQVQFNSAPAANWQVNVTDTQGVTNPYYTDTAGQAQVCGLPEGTYTVSDKTNLPVLPMGLVVNGTPLPPDSVYSFTWQVGKPAPVILFQNQGGFIPQ